MFLYMSMSLTFFLKTAREGAVLICWQVGHILVMSGELPTGVDRYTLIAWAQFSETGTELHIMEPYYEEPYI